MKLLLLSLSIIFSISAINFTTDNYTIVIAKGKVVTQERVVENFNQINYAIPGELILTQSDEINIEIQAPEDVQELIETKVVDNKLVIKSTKRIKTKKPIKVFVSVPELDLIELSGSGNIFQNGDWNFKDLKLLVEGSGNIKFEKSSIAGILDNKIAGSGNIKFENLKNTKNIKNKIAGSGNITLTSDEICDIIDIKIAGSGNVNVGKIATKQSAVSILGSGNVHVNVQDEITIVISGSGDVYVKGKPQTILKKHGSGDVIDNN